MRARYKACILSLLVPLALQGQDIGLLRKDPTAFGSRGTAQVYGGYEAGGYHPAFAPASLWKAGASAQGTLHGTRTSYTGSFSFEQIDGKEMFTSMFLEPGFFPVDVVEFTPGDKTRQTYRLGGGFATDLTDEFVFGVKADYQSANYAKRKDIRHTTYGMNLRVEPTLAFKMFDNAALSASFIFQKRTESIDAEQVGAATDKSYFAFLDKGMRYGTYQVWDGDGIHLDEAGVGVFPVKEYRNGFAYAIDTPDFAGGMEVLWKHGKVGEKGYDWFRYPGHSCSFFLERRWHNGHTLRFAFALEDDQLEEAVLDKVSSGGVTTPTVYGYNAVSDRNWGSLDLTWGVRFQKAHLKRLQAVLHGGLWAEQSYLMYPYEDRTDRYNGSLTLVSAFVFGPVDLGLRVNGVMGTWKEQGLQGGTDSVVSAPFRLQADWDRKMEYFSTSKLGAGFTLTYHLKAVRGLFIQAEGTWLHGFGTVLLPGADRWSSTARIGYGF
jgi:hypothetical protein